MAKKNFYPKNKKNNLKKFKKENKAKKVDRRKGGLKIVKLVDIICE